MDRIEKDELYLDVAEAMLGRATCLRRVYGSVIVKNDEIISSGYNGSPRGRCNCTDRGTCLRDALKIPSGERYELCLSVHAEANAIISASRDRMIGATLYLVGHDAKTGERINAEPCSMCKRMIINAGIKEVVARHSDNIHRYAVKDWIQEDEFKTIYNKFHFDSL